MARLYLLRLGKGEQRVASSFAVNPDLVREVYGNRTVHSTDGLPTINAETDANVVAGPEFAVIELRAGEPAFGQFRSPGFNLLEDVEPTDAHARLVVQAARR